MSNYSPYKSLFTILTAEHETVQKVMAFKIMLTMRLNKTSKKAAKTHYTIE